ncbi:hypothetical protein [Microbacterium oleivorans]|uniref:HK97 gp10 family phage protein n=1 Tax=Microbacterium oleivorans TaxID=273677 RepID=A0A4R5YG98_9MICO|nr:hypothetical protein [Microbacterium oleivorans]TDL43835.1 hypothetical protein E2R54_11640 [Microbacterium oleivorans]
MVKINTPILSTAEKAAVEGAKNAGRAILKRSNELAPRDDGDLIKSGGVRVDDLTVQIGYSAFHARFQHENLDYQHADGGQAKFLEAAADQVDVERFIADSVRKAFSG